MTEYKDYIASSGDNFCVGLDLHVNHLSPFLHEQMRVHGVEEFLWLWCSAVIKSTGDSARVFKIQSSFFEAYGDVGFRVMRRVTKFIKDQQGFVILDAKRSDISSTMKAYGVMAFEWLGADAMTVVPYLGTDTFQGLESWLSKKFLYIVALTSNPSWQDFQKKEASDDNGVVRPMADIVMSKSRDWFQKNGFHDSYGFVVGATHYSYYQSKQADPLLLPGMGFQGADDGPAYLAKIMQQNPRSVFPISRGITAVEGAQSWEGFAADLAKNAAHFKGLLHTSVAQ